MSPQAEDGGVADGSFTVQSLGEVARGSVATLVRDKLEEIRGARARLGDSEDVEALHDLRVAMRRLRSVLAGYGTVLGKGVGRGSMRRLSRIARTTNPSRDLEVQLEWLRSRASLLKRAERAGLDRLVSRLEARRQRSDGKAARRIEEDLESVLRALETELRDLRPDAMEGPTLRQLAGERIERAATTLRRRIERVEGVGDRAHAHRARIAGKRLRYLLEPLAGAEPLAADLVKRCKSFQDLLGDLHDADVWVETCASVIESEARAFARQIARAARTEDSEELKLLRSQDPIPGWVAIVGQIHEVRAQRWAATTAGLKAAADRLVAPALELSKRLSTPIHLEIERKFLLRAVPERAQSAPCVEIEQGYFQAREGERLRRTCQDGRVSWVRTWKRGEGLVREELEEPLDEREFERLWPLTEGWRLKKRRYFVQEGELKWEIDEFEGLDLVLAEVELPSVDTEAAIPQWLADALVREVTGDPRYANSSLARSSSAASKVPQRGRSSAFPSTRS
ncbi:MAG: CHAD domain-containing protein [Fimbriimonadaceae bacterium]|nr:CHAD domain-containing protein [Fimbriimonadaceae bacterium]